MEYSAEPSEVPRGTQLESRGAQRPAPVVSGLLPPMGPIRRVVWRCVPRDSRCVPRGRRFLTAAEVAARSRSHPKLVRGPWPLICTWGSARIREFAIPGQTSSMSRVPPREPRERARTSGCGQRGRRVFLWPSSRRRCGTAGRAPLTTGPSAICTWARPSALPRTGPRPRRQRSCA